MNFFINDIAKEFRKFEARKSDLFRPLRDVVTELARQAKAEVKAKIRAKKSGRRYEGQTDSKTYKLEKRGKRRVAVQTTARFRAYSASASGEAPASRTGTLIRSIRQARLKKADFGFFVFANSRVAFYRQWLEFGTKDRRGGFRGRGAGKIDPRPLFSPLNEKYGRLLLNQIDTKLSAALREIVR